MVDGSTPSAPTNLRQVSAGKPERMPFLVLGIILLIVGAIFLRKSVREQDKEGVVGVIALIVAAVIMIMFFGLFYTLTIF